MNQIILSDMLIIKVFLTENEPGDSMLLLSKIPLMPLNNEGYQKFISRKIQYVNM